MSMKLHAYLLDNVLPAHPCNCELDDDFLAELSFIDCMELSFIDCMEQKFDFKVYTCSCFTLLFAEVKDDAVFLQLSPISSW